MTEQRRRIEFFPISEAMDNAKSGMRGAMEMSQDTQNAMVDLAKLGGAAGMESQLLVREKDGFSLLRVFVKPGYILPRHSHDSDCLYYVESGSVVMGVKTLGPGDSFLVPEGIVYGYEGGPEGAFVLEIRHGVNQYGSIIPDQSAKYWDSLRERFAAKGDSWTAPAPN